MVGKGNDHPHVRLRTPRGEITRAGRPSALARDGRSGEVDTERADWQGPLKGGGGRRGVCVGGRRRSPCLGCCWILEASRGHAACLYHWDMFGPARLPRPAKPDRVLAARLFAAARDRRPCAARGVVARGVVARLAPAPARRRQIARPRSPPCRGRPDRDASRPHPHDADEMLSVMSPDTSSRPPWSRVSWVPGDARWRRACRLI